MPNVYEEIASREITPKWNEIDKAHALLQALLDDPDMRLSSEAGEIISYAANLIK